MGLWNFIKDAGKAIGIGDDDGVAPAAALEAEIADLGLDASGVDIAVEGDTVKMSGQSLSQEIKEKIILAAGNIAGIGAVEEDVSVPDAKEPVFHTVERGDTLWAISEKHLGNGGRYQDIFEANKPMLTHPDKIYPGQMLRIPA